MPEDRPSNLAGSCLWRSQERHMNGRLPQGRSWELRVRRERESRWWGRGRPLEPELVQ